MNNNQKGFSEVIFILIIVALVGAVGFFIYQNSQLKQEASQTPPIPTATLPPTSGTNTPFPATIDPTINEKTYTNTKYGYQINFPGDWVYNRGPGKVSDKTLSEQSEIEVYGLQAETPGTSFSTSFSIDTNTFHQTGLSKNCSSLDDCTRRSMETFSSYSPNIPEPSETTFLGKNAKDLSFVRVTDSYSQSWYHLFVIINDDFYHFSAYSSTENFNDYKLIFNQILSTFEFTE